MRSLYRRWKPKHLPSVDTGYKYRSGAPDL